MELDEIISVVPGREPYLGEQGGHDSHVSVGTIPVKDGPSAWQDDRAPALALPTRLSSGARRQDLSYYYSWFDHEAQRPSTRYVESAWRGFADQIQQERYAARKDLNSSFATIAVEYSAITTLTRGQLLALTLLLSVVVAGLYLVGPLTLTLLLGGVTLAYLVNLILTAAMAASVIGQAPEEHVSSDILRQLDRVAWPQYTVLCPLYGEAAVVPQFVAAMQALDYPPDKLQVLFLTECDDDATREAIRGLDLPSHFEIVTVPEGRPRTKPRACNYGLLLAKGSFVVIYDAEDIPDPLQLKKAVLAFANHDATLACVQAKLAFYNTGQNVLTRWFAIEYALWFGMILPGLQKARFSLPLGGTSNHFRTDILRRLGGWDVFNVTEDCDLGLRLAEHHLYTTILDSTTLEEANSNVRNWIRQRSRWIKGYMQTYLVHLRRPSNYISRGRVRELVSLFAIIGSAPATFLVNPVMWALLGLYIAKRQTLAPDFHILYVAPIFYPAVICLVAGNFLYLYLCLVACAKNEQYGLLPWVLTLPAYWALMCVAAGMALFQLCVNPHHWEKTHHGLHLPREAAENEPALEPVAAHAAQA
jgi:cellulose synthase/poly-beta-1,6-N-acetylglucosamine synthase-like glycosyltransferase